MSYPTTPSVKVDQTGRWKIDARFNAEQLANRVRLIGSYGSRIQVGQLDGRELIQQLQNSVSNYFLYVDPPYIAQGGELYMNSLAWPDHVELAETLGTVS